MRSGKHKAEGKPYQGQWKTIRRRVLTRDQHHCQIGLPGCTIDATTVDHITPIAFGGEWYDMANLRAACQHCNYTLGGLAKKHKPKPTVDNRTNTPRGANNENASRTW